MRGLEAEILKQAGYTVLLADGGRAAVQTLQWGQPDLVLLDIVMPDMNGWEVLRHIRTLEDPPPVIVATGLAEVVPPGTLGEHVAGYLFKPFRAETLLEMSADVLAGPLLTPPSGSRKEARRTYVVEAALLSEDGWPLATGRLVQISPAGFRFELTAPVRPGDTVMIAFRIPGRDRPLELAGEVRWRGAAMMGVEMRRLDPSDEDLLRRFVDAAGGDGIEGGAMTPVCAGLGH